MGEPVLVEEVMNTGLKLLNTAMLALVVYLMLADTLPGMIIRAAVVAPLWEMGVMDREMVRTLVIDGHW